MSFHPLMLLAQADNTPVAPADDGSGVNWILWTVVGGAVVVAFLIAGAVMKKNRQA